MKFTVHSTTADKDKLFKELESIGYKIKEGPGKDETYAVIERGIIVDIKDMTYRTRTGEIKANFELEMRHFPKNKDIAKKIKKFKKKYSL